MNQIDIYLQSIKNTNNDMKKDVVCTVVKNYSDIGMTWNNLYDRIIYALKKHICIDLEHIVFCDDQTSRSDHEHWFNIEHAFFVNNLKLSGLEACIITYDDQIKITSLVKIIEENENMYQKLIQKYYNRVVYPDSDMIVKVETD